MLVELIAGSVILALFEHGWIFTLFGIPIVMAAYASARFALSARARVIHDIECDTEWKWLYALIFAYNYVIAATCSGLTGFILDRF